MCTGSALRSPSAKLRSQNRALKFRAAGEIIAPAIHSRQGSRGLEAALAQQFHRPGTAPHSVYKNLLAGVNERRNSSSKLRAEDSSCATQGPRWSASAPRRPKLYPVSFPWLRVCKHERGMLKRDRPQQCASVSAKNFPVLIEHFFRHRTGRHRERRALACVATASARFRIR